MQREAYDWLKLPLQRPVLKLTVQGVWGTPQTYLHTGPATFCTNTHGVEGVQKLTVRETFAHEIRCALNTSLYFLFVS